MATPDLTPDQYYSLLSDAVKIGLPAIVGAFGGGVAAWFAARRTFKIKDMEHSFQKDINQLSENFSRGKIRYERDKEIITKTIELICDLSSLLNELGNKAIEFLVMKEDGNENAYIEHKNEFNRISILIGTKRNTLSSSIILIGNNPVINSYNEYGINYSESMKEIANTKVSDAISKIDYGLTNKSEIDLKAKLSKFFREMI